MYVPIELYILIKSENATFELFVMNLQKETRLIIIQRCTYKLNDYAMPQSRRLTTGTNGEDRNVLQTLLDAHAIKKLLICH